MRGDTQYPAHARPFDASRRETDTNQTLKASAQELQAIILTLYSCLKECRSSRIKPARYISQRVVL